MAQVLAALAIILRVRAVIERYGHSRSALYSQIAQGLWPRPIRLTTNKSAAWITAECDAVVRARIAGRSDEEIRALVVKLEAARATADSAAA